MIRRTMATDLGDLVWVTRKAASSAPDCFSSKFAVQISDQSLTRYSKRSQVVLLLACLIEAALVPSHDPNHHALYLYLTSVHNQWLNCVISWLQSNATAIPIKFL